MNTAHGEPAGVPHQGAPVGAGSPDLAGLLKQAARGDQGAFAEVYDATAARVHGLVVRVVRDQAQAEEVTQEVFLEVWRHCGRFDAHRGSALAWLMTIAHRKSVDRVRSADSSTRRDQTYHDANQAPEHDVTAETAHASLEARRVRAAVQELTDVQRQAIELAYFGGYSHREVAALLDLPLGTAKTRIRDGMIRLRDTIGVGR
ncbi:MAG: ECF RNA polymerase sigma factor SigK [Nocardioidaceae bacterium]|nr:ECF RNA polymerase sigma factor SigK [Nocardioidaceae bacterium]